MKLLTAQDIFDCDDIGFVDVDVPQWGGTVRVRALTAKEAMTFLGEGKQESMVILVARCVINEDGDRLFTDAQISKLKEKAFSAFIKIQKEAMRLNGLSSDEAKND